MYLKPLAYKHLIIIILFIAICSNSIIAQVAFDSWPNILLFITDDQSWIHTSFAGEQAIKTPGLIVLQEQVFILKMLFVLLPHVLPLEVQ